MFAVFCIVFASFPQENYFYFGLFYYEKIIC